MHRKISSPRTILTQMGRLTGATMLGEASLLLSRRTELRTDSASSAIATPRQTTPINKTISRDIQASNQSKNLLAQNLEEF